MLCGSFCKKSRIAMVISSTRVPSAKGPASRNWIVVLGVVASGGFPFVLRRLPSDDVLDLRHVAFGGRGGLLWRAPALASVHVRRVPIPPVMLGMRLLVLAVMLLRLVEEIGQSCDVRGLCSRQLPFASGKSCRDLLE